MLKVPRSVRVVKVVCSLLEGVLINHIPREDRESIGIWEVIVPADLPTGKQASIALDVFYYHVPLGDPSQFTIVVTDGAGQVFEPDNEPDDLDGHLAGALRGKVNSL